MKHLAFVALGLILSTGCAALTQWAATAPVADANALVVTAQTFANDLMAQEQPKITTAVAELPPQTQALAQAAYAALQKGIDAALEQGVMDLDAPGRQAAQVALIGLGQVTDFLHATLHDPHQAGLVPTPALPAGAPSVPVAPTPTVVVP